MPMVLHGMAKNQGHREMWVFILFCKYPDSERAVEEFLVAVKKIMDNIYALKVL